MIWQWTLTEQAAFDEMKKKLTETPILRLPDHTKMFFLYTDASSMIAIGGILAQEQDDGLLHPVAFKSKMLMKAEQNYPVHEQELLVMKHCFNKW